MARPARHINRELKVRCAHLVEARAAIHRPIVSWNERYASRTPALGADRLVVLARRLVGHQSTLALVNRAAGRAAPGLMHESFGREELLLTDGEQELLTAITTRKGFIRQAHSHLPPFPYSAPGRSEVSLGGPRPKLSHKSALYTRAY